jgi:hypothetical protein
MLQGEWPQGSVRLPLDTSARLGGMWKSDFGLFDVKQYSSLRFSFNKSNLHSM